MTLTTPTALNADMYLADDVARVTGAARYAADIHRPGALYAAVVRSTKAHAEVRQIDKSGALAVRGVHAVLTARDIGVVLIGRVLRDYPVLADKRVLFVGQPVAITIADTFEIAHAAARRVRVHYGELPTITTIADAKTSRFELHPEYESYVGSRSRAALNTQGTWSEVTGSPSKTRGEDVVVSSHYVVGPSHALALETHVCIVDATTTPVSVHAAHKEPYRLRNDLSLASGRPISDFAVEFVNIGGDFGSKGFPYVECMCYFASAHMNRPVVLRLTAPEDLVATAVRHRSSVLLTTRMRDGRILEHDVSAELDGGAFAGAKPIPTLVVPVGESTMTPYAVRYRSAATTSYYTNNVPAGHVRSPGEFQGVFAGECHIDELAFRLSVDPIDFRRRHAASTRVHGVLDVLSDARARLRAECGRDDGVGIALTAGGHGPGHSTVQLDLSAQGITLHVAVPDQGAGSYHALRSIAADSLAVSPSEVEVVAHGAMDGLHDDGAGASRVTAVVGAAVSDACAAALDKARQEYAQSLGAGPRDNPLRTLMAGLGDERLEFIATHSVNPTTDPDDRSYAAVAARVHVDRDTGAVRVLRAELVADCGHVAHPRTHRGQLEGGFVYGLSQSLYEDFPITDGIPLAATQRDYKIAAMVDVPPLTVHTIEPPMGSPKEYRPVGELVNPAVAPAIANAIYAAVKIRMKSLPITAEAVLTEITRLRHFDV